MRKEITEDQITQLLAGIPRAEEVDRLKAEIEGLRTENVRLVRKRMSEAWEEGWFARDCQEADWNENPYRGEAREMSDTTEDIRAQTGEEISDLRATVERLRESNRQLVAGIETIARRNKADTDYLRTENGRLRAENEHLHRAHQTACEGGDLLRAEIKRLTRERDEARTETERLRTENARLRARIAEYFGETDTHPMEDA